MKCASALSTNPESKAAFAEVSEKVRAALDHAPADIACLFVTAHHAPAMARLAPRLVGEGIARHVIGTTAESIVGPHAEIEQEPGVSLWAAKLPETARVASLRLESKQDNVVGWPQELKEANLAGNTLLILCDPFSFPADPWLRAMKQTAPNLKIIGGVSSGGHHPESNRLVLDGDVFVDGAVALLLRNIEVRTVVSQGCRPIGRHFIVTNAENNIIQELGRRPALDVLRELFEELSPEDQELVQTGLHVGIVVNEYQETFGRGDFLARNVVGTTREGGVAITDSVRVGRTVCFMVHDAASAREDLRELLSKQANSPSHGALLFTCNGRGRRLFDQPHHDVTAFAELFGALPIAGFFAMGEIGPVCGQNALHGFTASLALFS
jgi:small ligand-binding sensory domain FIST